MSQPTPPVVFVHGLIGTFDMPEWPGPHLAPDLLGYGIHRDAPSSAITLAKQVEHVRQAIDAHFGAQPVDIVGHSVGGAIAMLFAHAHPARVRRIVNVEGNFTPDDAFWSASVSRMSAAQADAMLDGLRGDPFGWLRGSIDDPSPRQLVDARRWLAHQPASTLRAMGRRSSRRRANPNICKRSPTYSSAMPCGSSRVNARVRAGTCRTGRSRAVPASKRSPAAGT